MSLSKSGIPYLTHVWNVAVGCYGPGGTAEKPNRCPYCWCGPLLKRIGANIGCELCLRNAPHVHPERLHIPAGKPKVIGVGFMTDLFGVSSWSMGTWPTSPISPRELTEWTRGLYPILRNHAKTHPEHVFVMPTRCPEGIPDDLEPPDNWWLLVTCTTQAEIGERVPAALERWRPGGVVLNLEPLCKSVQAVPDDVTSRDDLAGVILGGMSRQPGAPAPVPLDPDWVRSVRDECAEAGVPFYFKRWSDANPGGRLGRAPVLDGCTHRELPWENQSIDTDSHG